MNRALLTAVVVLLLAAGQLNGQTCLTNPTLPARPTGCNQDAYFTFPTYPNCWATNPFTNQLYAGPEHTNIGSEGVVQTVRSNLITALWGTDGFPQRSDLSIEKNITASSGCLHLDSTPQYDRQMCYPFGSNATPPNQPQIDRLTILTPVSPGDFAPDTGAQTAASAPRTLCDLTAVYGGLPAVTSVVYFYHPKTSNGRLAIFVHGHEDRIALDGGQEIIDTLLAEGFSVLAFWMPFRGENERCHEIPYYRGSQCPDPNFSGSSCPEAAWQNVTDHSMFWHVHVPQGNATKVFLEPIAVAINYAIRNASAFRLATPVDISMYGISGGGWTTTAYAAVDPRVKVSFPTSGSLPKYVFANNPPDNRPDPLSVMTDYEIDQRTPSEGGSSYSPNVIYRYANTSDLYILGAAGAGRKAWQVLNQFDDCCHWGVGYQTYLPGLRDGVSDPTLFPAGGQFQVYLNQNNDNNGSSHKISPVEARSVSFQELDGPLYLPTVDFTGDGIADPAIFRPADRGTGDPAKWSYINSAGTVSQLQGIDPDVTTLPGDQPVPADYFHDGHADVAVYRPLNGGWYIRRNIAADQSLTSITNFLPDGVAGAGDIPLPGDYDGDGRADLAIFRPSNGTWYVRLSNSSNAVVSLSPADAPWGSFRPGDVPVPGIYDGHDKTEFALFRPTGSGTTSGGTWYVVNSWSVLASSVKVSASTANTVWTASVPVHALPVPSAGDIPVPADYDGDGVADMAFFRPAEPNCVGGVWYIRYSGNPSSMTRLTWTNPTQWVPGDRPIQGRYQAASGVEPALFRPSNGHWYFQDGRDIQVRSDPKVGDLPLGTRTNWAYPADTVSIYPSIYPPIDVTATASHRDVTIAWHPSETWPSPASVEYELWRSDASTPGSFTQVTPSGGPVGSSTTYTDHFTADGAFVYKVRARVTAGTNTVLTDFSNVDLTTTVALTDEAGLSGKPVRGSHVTELYNAVNMVLATAGLQLLAVPNLQTSPKPLATQLQTLRDALSRAYTVIGMPLPPSFPSGSVSANKTATLARHFHEIRHAVNRAFPIQ
jgi:hypothetical protein